MIMSGNAGEIDPSNPALGQAMSQIQRMLRSAEDRGLDQDRARECLVNAINAGLASRRARRQEQGRANAQEDRAVITEIPSIFLGATPTAPMEIDEQIADARRSQMSALTSISQRILEAEDNGDDRAAAYWQNQYDRIHGLMWELTSC